MTLILSFGLAFQASAASGIITQDMLIADADFSQQLFKAYENEMVQKADGSYEFSNLLRCKADQCWLMKGQWETVPESRSLNNIMFTPVLESAVWDLTEYMRVQPTLDYKQGHVIRSKEISATKAQKEYSLKCADAQNQQTGAIVFGQCVLMNGIPVSTQP